MGFRPLAVVSRLLAISIAFMLSLPVAPVMFIAGRVDGAGTGADNPQLYGNITAFPSKTTALDMETSRSPSGLDFDIPLGSEVAEATVDVEAILPYQPRNYGVGTDPQALEVADLNRDGWPDIVTADKASGDEASGMDTVSVLLNDRVGGLSGGGKAQTYQVGDGPVDLAVVDVTLDGWPDVVTVDENTDTITVLPNGVGQALDMTRKGTYDLDGTPRAMVVAQLDGAAGNDVAVVTKKTVTEYDENTGEYTFKDVTQLLLHPNDGKGVLGAARATSLENLSITDMAVADMDGDGDKDLVVASSTPPFKAIMLLNDGSGNFPTRWTAALPGPPAAMAFGDLDRDSRTDVAVVSPEGPLSILMNRGGGTMERRDYTMSANRMNVAFSDIDNDGDLDILTVDRAQNLILVMRNDGTGSLSYTTIFFMGNNPTDVVTFDVDADGDQDIASCNIGDESVSLMWNSGTGTFQWYQNYYIRATGEVGLGDFDADGNVDVLSTNYNDHSITVAFNPGNGNFTREGVDYYPGYRVYGAGGVGGSEPFFPTSGDFDGDGDLDAIYGEELSYSIILLENDGKGKFTQTSVANDENGLPLLPAPPFQTMADDIDGDGDLDIVNNHINHPFLSVLLNDGKANFSVRLNQSMDGHFPYDYVMRDLDGDGDMDIVTSNYGNGSLIEDTISFLRNDGGGHFTHVGDHKVDKAPRTIDMADVNGDGKEDIVLGYSLKPESIANIKPSYIHVLTTKTLDIRAGSERFEFDIAKYDAGILPGHVHAMDIEGDGDVDIYCLNMGIGQGATLSVFINDGTGKFATPAIEYAGFPDKFHVFTDFDGDARDEMVIPTLTDHITVFWNLYYPGDVTIQVGANVTLVDTMTARSGVKVNLTGLMNSYLDVKRPPEGTYDPNVTVKVPVSITAAQRGVVRLSGLRMAFVPHVTPVVPPDGKKDNVTEPFRFDLREGRTQVLLFLVGMLVVISLTLGPPKAAEEVVAAKKAPQKKGKGKKGMEGKTRKGMKKG